MWFVKLPFSKLSKDALLPEKFRISWKDFENIQKWKYPICKPRYID